MMQSAQAFQRGAQIGSPDIAPVDHAHRQHLVLAQPVCDLCQLGAAAHRVDMHACDWQACGDHQIVVQGAEVIGQQQFHACAVERVVGALERAAPFVRQIQAQYRLIDLHPLYTQFFQPRENLPIHGQEPVQQIQPVESRCFFLGQVQESQWADQYRLGIETRGLRLGDFLEQPFHAQFECRVGF